MKYTKEILIGLGLIIGLFFVTSCGEDEPDASLTAAYVEDLTRDEGNSGTSEFTFKVRLTVAIEEDVTISYETQNITAMAGEDYEATSGSVTIVAGEREATFVVNVIGDGDYETDEIFKIKLSNSTNADITDGDGTGTITNDDDFAPTGNDGYQTPLSYTGYNLVWNDEFDGTALNVADWNYETGDHGWGNNELQNYRSGENNATVNNGKLVIEAKEENGGYTSARLTTQGKQSFRYGRIDIRAKLPFGQGIWPALWMLGDSFGSTGWPSCGEIDIMEMVGHNAATTHGTIHWDNNGSHADYGGSTTINTGMLADEFHVYSIIWDTQEIKWLLDDVQFHNVSITQSEMSEFHANFFFIFNVAVGGNWPGYPDATTTFPQRMIVDYVRVFQ
ncbi:MAG: family 16 glycosylhydrolase [Saprospiraceae bacterium]